MACEGCQADPMTALDSFSPTMKQNWFVNKNTPPATNRQVFLSNPFTAQPSSTIAMIYNRIDHGTTTVNTQMYKVEVTSRHDEHGIGIF